MLLHSFDIWEEGEGVGTWVMVFSYWSRVRMSPSVLLLIYIRRFRLCNTTSSVHNTSMVLFLFRELTSYFLSNFSRMKLCVGFCSSCNSKLFWLMLFEPLSIAFESLQVIWTNIVRGICDSLISSLLIYFAALPFMNIKLLTRKNISSMFTCA